METVKTSDALESQIVEEARAKARRILESADRECATIRTEGETKRAEEGKKADAGREGRIAALRREHESTVPLDTMRARLSFMQEAVSGALKEMFDSFSDAELTRLIGNQVVRAASAFKDSRVVAWCAAGMDAEAARRIVRENLPGASVEEVKRLPDEQGLKTGKGIILESTDGRIRYRATLNELAELLLEEYREELVTALFGKDVQR